MRLSLRVGSAAVLIIIALFVINRNLPTVDQAPKRFWHFDTTSFRAPTLRPQETPQEAARRKWGTGSSNKVNLDWSKTPIEVPNEGVIVMGRMRDQDTAWVGAELSEYMAQLHLHRRRYPPFPATPKNKGREALPYLQFIVDHYDDLPTVCVFLHAHRNGWPEAWHTDTMEYSNVDSVRALQREFVVAEGFPFRNPPKPGDTGEKYYAQAWKELFNNSDVPEVIGAPCCSQFAVSRDQILKRPLSDYQRMYDWVLNNDLPDEITSNIMEYSWHIIFGREPVFCPDVAQCYADVYGEEVITF
ncbi:hypothetical protein N7470_006581 [Penicillium chermesinum]|nr:hypothetical protein N7470_006581 [Penicillium chermesinum]